MHVASPLFCCISVSAVHLSTDAPYTSFSTVSNDMSQQPMSINRSLFVMAQLSSEVPGTLESLTLLNH